MTFVSAYNIFRLKYVKGMCGLRSKKPLFINPNDPKDLILLHALNRYENEKNQASPDNVKLKERSNRILQKLFDEYRK